MEKEQLNILPFEGEVLYLGQIIEKEEASKYLEKLLKNIEWKHDEAIIFGKLITTKRKVAWYGDKNFEYSYSKRTRKALQWTNELLELKNIVEKISKTKFNSCLLNLYHNGEEGMAYHSDDEKSLGKNTTIASLSFGAKRQFSLKHKKTKYKVDISLEPGSLLLMKGSTQTNWLHAIPKTKKIKEPRINLTFRTMIQ